MMSLQTQKACVYLFFCIVMGMLFFSCERTDTWQSIVLPQTFMFNDSYQYIVPREPYLRIFAEKDTHSTVLQIVRADSILFIEHLGDTDDEGYLWAHIANDATEGWVLVYDPIVCYSYAQALLFSRRLRK